jgi:CBS domain-containing protein
MSNEPKAADFMNKDIETVTADMSLNDVVEFFISGKRSNAPVVLNGEFVGFISEADCLRALTNELYYSGAETTVRHIMKTHPVCVQPDTDIFSIVSLFTQSNYRHVPVVDGKSLVGIISRKDALKSLQAWLKEFRSQKEKEHTSVDFELIMNRRFLIKG